MQKGFSRDAIGDAAIIVTISVINTGWGIATFIFAI